jgi:pimeloyl-ACP methyl ester carboxylesterase
MSMLRPGARTARSRRAGAASPVVGVAVLLGVAACTSSGSAATPPAAAASTQPGPAAGSTQDAGSIVPTHSTLDWHSCARQLAEDGVPDCTLLSVPLNYADPAGRVVGPALSCDPGFYNAVQCTDASWPRSWAYWASDTEMIYKTAPFYAWGNAWFNAACAFWPVKGLVEPLQIKGAGLPGILMLQGTLDPATPYAGAQDAHKLLPSARMVVVEGGGNHGQSLADPPNSCVQSCVNAYLATGALPQSPGLVNATCPAGPGPTPADPGG